jgi:hypothetical protein
VRGEQSCGLDEVLLARPGDLEDRRSVRSRAAAGPRPVAMSASVSAMPFALAPLDSLDQRRSKRASPRERKREAAD